MKNHIEKVIENIDKLVLSGITTNKNTWGDGPWASEPEEWWSGEYNGHILAAVRNCLAGSWCGYTNVPKDHKYALIDYMELPLEVHGGVTYGRDYLPAKIPIDDPLRDKIQSDFYWIGFDCAHFGQDATPYSDVINRLMPARSKRYIPYEEATYKTLDFVIAQLKSLVDQIESK